MCYQNIRISFASIISLVLTALVLSACTNNSVAEFEKGEQAYHNKNYMKAIEYFDKLSEEEIIEGNNFTAVVLSYYQTGNIKDAEHYFELGVEELRKDLNANAEQLTELYLRHAYNYFISDNPSGNEKYFSYLDKAKKIIDEHIPENHELRGLYYHNLYKYELFGINDNTPTDKLLNYLAIIDSIYTINYEKFGMELVNIKYDLINRFYENSFVEKEEIEYEINRFMKEHFDSTDYYDDEHFKYYADYYINTRDDLDINKAINRIIETTKETGDEYSGGIPGLMLVGILNKLVWDNDEEGAEKYSRELIRIMKQNYGNKAPLTGTFYMITGKMWKNHTEQYDLAEDLLTKAKEVFENCENDQQENIMVVENELAELDSLQTARQP